MWGARVGNRRRARGLAALVAVVVTVSLLGIAQAGAQQNPPVNQPGVTNSEIRVGGVGTVTGDPTGNNPGGPAFDGRASPATLRPLRLRYFGGMRRAPSMRIVSPLIMAFSTMCAASAANSAG